METEILKLYHSRYIGPSRIYYILKEKYPDITYEYVSNVLKTDKEYQKYLYKKKRRYIKTSAYSLFYTIQSDIADMSSSSYDFINDKNKSISLINDNDGYRYIIVFIDTFSRYAWTFPLKNKDANTVSDIINKFLHSFYASYKKLFNIFLSDYGNEYINKDTQRLLKNDKIRYYSVIKCYIAERFIKTLKQMLYKYMIENKTKRWVDKLEEFTDIYNNSYHSTIKMTPLQATNELNETEVFNNLYSDDYIDERNDYFMFVNPEFEINDLVRIKRDKTTFIKSAYIPRYSDKIYRVVKVLQTYPYTYKIEILNTDKRKKKIKNIYYGNELVLYKKRSEDLI